MEITQSEQQREKRNLKNENSLWTSKATSKCTNILFIGVSEGEERKKRIKNVFDEVMAENFLNLKKETDIQFQAAQRVPNKMKQNRSTPKHIIIKMAKVKN